MASQTDFYINPEPPLEDYLELLTRAQEYTMVPYVVGGLSKADQKYYHEKALEWFDYIIENHPKDAYGAYVGKMMLFRLQGKLKEAKIVLEMMKNTEHYDESLECLFP